jgi:hypothetical protein
VYILSFIQMVKNNLYSYCLRLLFLLWHVQVTREALDKAIAICGPGVELKKIGHTIK